MSLKRKRGEGELKVFQFLETQDGISTAGDIRASINGVGQGTGPSDRVGRNILLTSIQWRYALKLPSVSSAAVQTGDSVRLIIFLDKQCNGEDAGVTDIFDITNIHSFLKLTNTDRFEILFDKLHDINYGGLTGGGFTFDQAGVIQNYSMKIAVNVNIEFSGATGLIDNIRSNNIGILFISQEGNTDLRSVLRIRYFDN